ncbi:MULTISPECIES: division/cell wall cluster transcriptional repressor MraZ [Roseomonadaceae]|jgi:MraZ protein|uniref:Transcriptional regulator MraZ n=1 Tax=Falsiroseomonas oleicola TaxID=2801474 RepID=A0ABS6HFT7_9PROT|nr:division/cell wall cluster transcriptional repressor MraZ [Roseomonas oleicola]MBU8546563.1 division/cell wall cluster transcriptional repressor MraZ [Roseomonas oleicola]
MTQFVGTHFGKLDRKGRISVPAIFRAELEAAATNQLVFRLAHTHPCIEARSRPVFQQIVDSIQALPHFSEERELLEATLISGSEMLKLDGEGRLVLPAEMIEDCALGEQVGFLGKGDRFEIWNEEAARAHVADAKKRARELRLTVAATPLNTTPRGVS